jgi:hypothetical protein
VDIEGAEIHAIPEWIRSGILEDVDQIGMEIHTVFSQDIAAAQLSAILDAFRTLHVAGFRLISSTNNDCTGKSVDFERKYYNLAEIVFRRVK